METSYNTEPDLCCQAWGVGINSKHSEVDSKHTVIPEETKMGQSWKDSFAMIPTHIELCDIKGISAVRQSNLEIVSNMHHVKVNLGSGTEDVRLHANHSTMKAVQCVNSHMGLYSHVGLWV